MTGQGKAFVTESSGLPAGAKLGPYRIQKELGRGGFSLTYKALDTKLDRPVVIKEYLPVDFAVRRGDQTVGPRSASQAESFQLGLESFLKEAQTLAKFHHPSIVPVLDFFQSPDSTAYMVMPFLEGETLAARLERSPNGRLSEGEILAWLDPLLDGLQTIHAAGFLHRDLKPENIYLLKNGTPLLIDFGSARNALVGRSRSLSVVLTPGYAPVEQYSTQAATQGPWTDLYALGAVIYRCLAGFAPSDSTERQDAVLNGEPDPLGPKFKDLPSLAGPVLAAVMRGCLRLARKERIQGVAELRAMLKGTNPQSRESSYGGIVDLVDQVADPAKGEKPEASATGRLNGYSSKGNKSSSGYEFGNSSASSMAISAEPQPEKYGGCLILLGIQLVLGSLMILYVLGILMDLPLSYHQMVYGLFLLAWLYVTVLFFQKKSTFPKFYIFTGLAINIIFGLLYGADKDLFSGIVWQIIWICYLSSSKRVKQVFIK